MKITCHRETFLAACQLASAAVPSKNVKPVLRNLKATVGEGVCFLTATDLEIGIRVEVAVTTDKPGDALLPAALVIAALRESRDADVMIEADRDTVLIRGDSSEFEFPSEDASTFPDLPTFDAAKCHEVASAVFQGLVRRTTFAALTEEHAKFGATKGVLVELESERISLVATDGRRLSVANGPAQQIGEHCPKKPVVPVRALAMVERGLGGDTVKMQFRANEAFFRSGGVTVYTRLIDGLFPNWRMVVPKSFTEKISLDVEAIQTATRQAKIATSEESKRVGYSFAKGRLTLQAKATNGRSKAETAVDFSGKPFEISFDPQFVLEMLKAIDSSAPVEMAYVDERAPAVFRQGADFTHVIVPLVGGPA